MQSVLNSTPLARLGNKRPLTVFTRLPAGTPLTTIKQTISKAVSVKSLEKVKALQRIEAEKIQVALDNIHVEVHGKVTVKRERERHNSKTGLRPINFTTGDYVLRGIVKKEQGKKTELRWRGPYRVTACLSDYIFQVEDLLSGCKRTFHGRRLKFFRKKNSR